MDLLPTFIHFNHWAGSIREDWTFRLARSGLNQIWSGKLSKRQLSFNNPYSRKAIISDGSNTILSNIDWTRKLFFEHRKNSNVFICWWSNSNTLFLALNDRTSNFEPNRAFTKFSKLLIEQNQTSVFQTLKELRLVHLLVIELEHPIFGFERSNIELRT